MKSTKALTCLLVSVFTTVTMMSGCNSTTNSVEKTNAIQSTALPPITYTIKSVAPGKSWDFKDTPVGKKFFDKTGVDFTMEYSVGDEQQNISLLLAGDELPDLVAPHYIVAPFIDAGKVLDLTSLIEKNAPNYKKYLGTTWDRMKWSKTDQKRYYFAANAGETLEQFDYINWFLLQNAVVVDQNYPELTTLDQYENAIKSYVQKYPTIEGQPTIGLSLVCDQWRWILSLTNPSMIAAGVQSSGEVYVDPITKKITYRITRPEEKEYYKWLNHMYNTGLLDKEAFTQTYDQYKAKVAAGRVVAVTDMGWEIMESEQVLRKEGKFDRTYGAYPITVKEGEMNASFAGGRVLSSPAADLIVTTSCKSPERLMKFVEYFNSEEGQILANWGIEGQNYDIVNGKRVFKQSEKDQILTNPDYSRTSGVGLLLGGFPSRPDGTKDSTGQYFTINSKEDVTKNYSVVEKKVLSAYKVETFADLFPSPDKFPLRNWVSESTIVNLIPADSDAKVIYTKMQDVIKKDVVKAVMAKADQFDAEWNNFLTDMDKAGQKTFEKTCEDLMKEQLDIWGIK